MLEPIPFAGMIEVDESFDRTASHMLGDYVAYNDPVAWMVDSEVYLIDEIDGEELKAIPLYTHPAKTLTDEEIYQLAEYHGINDWLYETSVIDFARAILRKAQEK